MKIKILFNRKKKLNTQKMAVIEVEVYVSRNLRFIKSTGIYLEPKYWDENKSRIKNNHPQAPELNYRLINFKNELERQYISEYYPYGYFKAEKKKRFFYEYFENEVMFIHNENLSVGTKRIYTRTLKYLKKFRPIDFPIEEVDIAFLQSFNLYLTKQKGLANNGRHSLFTKIRKVMRAATLDDIITPGQDPFLKGFKIREIEPEKTSLTLKELTDLEELDMTLRPELILTRDMFLFQCYTSLRYGDVSTLTQDNFDLLENNKIRLHYIPQKTKNVNNKRISWIITDFWNGKADAIIKKYLDGPGMFFKISNEYYNRQLKELQRFAEIKTVLTSHLARKTCITLLINDYGLDIAKTQMIAGHSKIEMTRRYLKIDERDLSEAAKKIEW
ncbi:MAG: site-specific integrase [Brumimicrobium sp.]|nr:site-specific integrase [Brumimicrobium sp.]